MEQINSDDILQNELSRIRIGETKSEFDINHIPITSDLAKAIIGNVCKKFYEQKLQRCDDDLGKEFKMPVYEDGDTAYKGFNDGIETHRELAIPVIAKLKEEVEKRTKFIDKCSQEIGKLEQEIIKLEADKDRMSGTILNAGKELIVQDNQIKELKEGLKYILEGNDKYQMEQRCITLLDKYK